MKTLPILMTMLMACPVFAHPTTQGICEKTPVRLEYVPQPIPSLTQDKENDIKNIKKTQGDHIEDLKLEKPNNSNPDMGKLEKSSFLIDKN